MKPKRSYGKAADRALALWVKLARASSTFGKLTERHIHSFGLTEPQFAALECLGHLGPLTLGELSRKMLVSGGNVTCVVGHLERDGLVERIHPRGDRRKSVARLTPRGSRLFSSTFRKHAAHVAGIASVLDAGEQEELSRLLRKLGLAIAGNNGRASTAGPRGSNRPRGVARTLKPIRQPSLTNTSERKHRS